MAELIAIERRKSRRQIDSIIDGKIEKKKNGKNRKINV
jgi:hypothetical protein